MLWIIIAIYFRKKGGNSTKKSRKRHNKNENNESDVVLPTNWISKINIKKSYFKREKLKKGTKHRRTERHDIKGVII